MREAQFKTPFILIGMHRSGTSFLSRLMHAHGIFMGYDQSVNAEARYFQKRNIKLLQSNGFSWDKPEAPPISSPIDWSDAEFDKSFLGLHRNPLRRFKIWKEDGLANWGWKDPRNTFTLSSWLKLFPNSKCIHIYRNGMDVALSLYKRNNKMESSNFFFADGLQQKTYGIDLWESYYLQSESYKAILGEKYLKIQYEKLIAQDPETTMSLSNFIQKDITNYLSKNADPRRGGSHIQAEHNDLKRYAQKNSLMKKLGYV